MYLHYHIIKTPWFVCNTYPLTNVWGDSSYHTKYTVHWLHISNSLNRSTPPYCKLGCSILAELIVSPHYAACHVHTGVMHLATNQKESQKWKCKHTEPQHDSEEVLSNLSCWHYAMIDLNVHPLFDGQHIRSHSISV